MVNRWIEPDARTKPTANEVMTNSPINPISFYVMKKQVRKKKLTRKSKKERIADKSALLAERLGYDLTK